MYEKTKYLIILLTVTSQIGAIVAIFFNVTLAIALAIIYGISLISLITIFIVERRKEKKEEINYDDFDY
ncbi:hypothetical protein E3U55_05895 [Filobacillus milosensis]|uniref:Uncharacterized protein n=1 Tax=Filobacillus milosensis TaxID=94137 RepID=A0A4Y8IMX5_9BACI|nr:hypothetical protein [Filobacillus milosensis]TFB22767.1 hypothetical protein E3U55_05895 [Filobacillus milosensis]